MSEPEEVLIDAAWRVTVATRELWRRHAPSDSPEPTLEDVRGRLESFLTATFGRCPPIAPAEPPAPRSWLYRVLRPRPRHLRNPPTLASTDGVRIRLPAQAGASTDPDPVSFGQTLRWRAVAMVARAHRGTAGALPADPLVRDLYVVAEAAAVDAWIARELPGLWRGFAAERREALRKRPALQGLTPREGAMEQLVRDVLAWSPQGTDPAPHGIPLRSDPASSLRWARARADELATREGPYRGSAPVEPWGRVDPLPPEVTAAVTGEPQARVEQSPRHRPPRSASLRRQPTAREPEEDEDDARAGTFVVKDDALESVEDPMGMQRPTDRDDEADASELADALADLPEARLVRTPEPAREALVGGDPPAHRPLATETPLGTGLVYPEWDHRRRAYRMPGAVVREPAAAEGDPAWARDALARHGVLVREVRRRFERLRLRRVRLDRQLDGPEVDVEAYVRGLADRRAGCETSDRLYATRRPLRRELAVCLLIDASASTDAWVSRTTRVVDVEKEALLVVCEALEMLGDPYGILAFSGEGPSDVWVRTLKGFDERYGEPTRRRIAGLEPDRYTRVGAALRHATAALERQSARHRLLLLLSDGKPNDVDRYEGRYGVEDTRQAVVEARLAGLHPFCLAVDRHAPMYAPRLFGPGAFAVLPHPERLPRVLVDLLRRLLVA